MEKFNTDIKSLKEIVSQHFPEYWKHIELCLATTATLLLKDNSNPTAIVLIGVPSTGKSTVLDLFRGIENITYTSDGFTAKAFVSHYADKKQNKLKNIDLLERITKKCFIISDLGTIFGKRREDLAESLGILTRILDGRGFANDSGVHGRREVLGDRMFSMLCGTTPFGYKVWDEMGRFGSRLIFLTMPDTQLDSEDIIQRLKGDSSYGEKNKICQEAVKSFLEGLWKTTGGFRSVDWNNKEMSDNVLRNIIEFGQLLSRLRGMIQKMYQDREGDFQHQAPIIESPQRVISLLLNLAKGRAVIYGRDQITQEDILPLIDIVVSSCPDHRGKIFKALVTRETLTIAEVNSLVGGGKNMATQAIENLRILGIVKEIEGQASGVGRPPKVITLSSEIKRLKVIEVMREYFLKSATDIST